MENIGSEVAAVAIPGPVDCAAGSYLRAKLARHLGCSVSPPRHHFYRGAEPNYKCTHLENKSSGEIVVTRGVFTSSGEESIRVAPTQMVVEWADHVWTHTSLEF